MGKRDFVSINPIFPNIDFWFPLKTWEIWMFLMFRKIKREHWKGMRLLQKSTKENFIFCALWQVRCDYPFRLLYCRGLLLYISEKFDSMRNFGIIISVYIIDITLSDTSKYIESVKIKLQI